MGVKWLKEQLDEIQRVTSTSYPGNSCLDLTYRGCAGETFQYRIYAPGGDEYLIGQDVVDRVRGLGVTLLVAGTYCRVAMAAKAYAESRGIPILGMKEFFAKVHNGQRM